MGRPKMATICHPDRPHAGLGMCRNCYELNRVKNFDPVAKSKHKAKQAEYTAIHRDRILKRNRAYRKRNYEMYMVKDAERRAAKKNLQFELTDSDVIIPEKCPILDITLDKESGRSGNTPSLDRIDPKEGYVKSNVWVISYRANTIKSDATLGELELITKNLRKKLAA